MNKWFANFANKTADYSGRWPAFILACALIVGWAASGPFLHFSQLWQLTINTGTTIITFLMVFLLQHAGNVSNAATQIKLDELLLTSREARNDLIDVEEDEPDAIEAVQNEMRRVAKTSREEGEPPEALTDQLAKEHPE
jgi:low affinity Fe/Cu permease